MTIKSDLWLRKMAEEQQMITPFLPELVRETDGNKIISAGCSSYGYDMRLADDGFRVFSPIRGLEIDPKKFDEASLDRTEHPNRRRRREILSAAAASLRFGRNGRNLQNAAQSNGSGNRQINLRASRSARQRDTARSRLGRSPRRRNR